MSDPRTTTETEDRALLEAALFLAPQPMTRRALAKILGDVQREYIDRLLDELKREYDRDEHGLELHMEEGRAGFRVKTAFLDRVQHLAPQQDIPRPILRTLAVIAYNHPMRQSDLVKVRGNKAYGHVQDLLARGLIRAEESGRTLLLHVTREFLRHFGLSTVEEFRFHVAGLPELEVESEPDQEPENETAAAGTPSDADSEAGAELGATDEPPAEPPPEAEPEEEDERESEEESDDEPDDGLPASEGGG